MKFELSQLTPTQAIFTSVTSRLEGIQLKIGTNTWIHNKRPTELEVSIPAIEGVS